MQKTNLKNQVKNPPIQATIKPLTYGSYEDLISVRGSVEGREK
jgi:hypothetical protein